MYVPVCSHLAGALQVLAGLGVAADDAAGLPHPLAHQPVSVSVPVEVVWCLVHAEGHSRVAGDEIILNVPQKAKKPHHLPETLENLLLSI